MSIHLRRCTLERICRAVIDVLDDADEPLSVNELGLVITTGSIHVIRIAALELVERGEVVQVTVRRKQRNGGEYSTRAFELKERTAE